MKKQFRTTAIHRGMVHMMLLTVGSAALAQSAAEKPPANLETVVITGQRAALQSAQKIKQNAEEIVDSVVAEEAGKLPDKSITEVLQRVVGVIIDRNKSRGDPEHFSVEGSGISVRGLSWGSSLLNGRESFSAGWPGRELSWGDIPPELMAGVDVYKNPSSEIIEGGVSGTVNLRTALPFDYKGTKAYLSVGNNYTQRSGKNSPSMSGLYTTQWNTDIGRVGVLLDLSYNHSSFQNESIQLDAYYPRTDLIAGQVAWAPKSASFRNNTGDNERAGFYGALQWKKDRMDSSLTYFVSGARETGSEQGFYTGVENAYKSTIDPATAKYDANNVLTSGTYTYLTGAGANTSPLGGLGLQITRGWNQSTSRTSELAWNFKWAINDQWLVQNDVQWVHAKNDSIGRNLQLGTFVPSMSIDVPGKSPVRIGFDPEREARPNAPRRWLMAAARQLRLHERSEVPNRTCRNVQFRQLLWGQSGLAAEHRHADDRCCARLPEHVRDTGQRLPLPAMPGWQEAVPRRDVQSRGLQELPGAGLQR
ncbi:MAG: TonB-dependent receptor plug domain-containing protein [Burkholderiales bacterium]|nr:TonB-dependent receptor plug domain-containing protein [Burkholderiales bacterium]